MVTPAATGPDDEQPDAAQASPGRTAAGTGTTPTAEQWDYQLPEGWGRVVTARDVAEFEQKRFG